MLQVDMSASFRSVTGKGAMRRLRVDGFTPAVVYGGGGEALALQLESKTLMAKLLEFYRRNTLVTLKIDGEAEKNVLISEVQTHPVTDALIHVDFFEIDTSKERDFNVPVVYEGVAKGVDLGGILLVNQYTVVLKGKPMDIPDHCILDITDLAIGDSLKCKIIAIPDSVKMVTDAETTAVAVVKPGMKETDETEDGEALETVEDAESSENTESENS